MQKLPEFIWLDHSFNNLKILKLQIKNSVLNYCGRISQGLKKMSILVTLIVISWIALILYVFVQFSTIYLLELNKGSEILN